jgi:hypothetical protein
MFWKNHHEKENRTHQRLQKESISKFYSKNKYNFILNKHYNPQDEMRFIEKEKKLEEFKVKHKEQM